MKVNQIELPETEECEHCALHQEVDHLYSSSIECAWCGSWSPREIADSYTIGETNSISNNEDEQITHTWVLECLQCHKHTGYMPTKIIWNANHNTYYTGGRSYIPDICGSIELDSKIEQEIEDYTKRILAGEDTLRPWNLRVWIRYAIEAAVADILYKVGLKR